MVKKLALGLLISLVVLVLGLLAVEFGFRWFYPSDGRAREPIKRMQQYLKSGDPALVYQAHPFVSHVQNPGWIPSVNSLGFVGPEWARYKPNGTRRVVCIGASTTMNYPRILEKLLNERAAQPVEVLNFGMPAWTTAESVVNFCLNGQDYFPDVVVIHHAVNDMLPRMAPGYRSDYSHWRIPFRYQTSAFTRALGPHSQFYCYILWKQGMRDFDVTGCMARPIEHYVDLKPETGYGFARNIRTMIRLARAIGAEPVLATLPCADWDVPHVAFVRDHNRRLRNIGAKLKVGVIDLAKMLEGRNDIYRDVVHFKHEFHHLRAEPIAEHLLTNGLIPPK